jgi:hypothetical protein
MLQLSFFNPTSLKFKTKEGNMAVYERQQIVSFFRKLHENIDCVYMYVYGTHY